MKQDFRHFFEDKDRLIDKLDLTDDQKSELKAFFKKHPNYENKIDWNNKSLQYKDFEEVLALEGNSENSKKKYGLSGKAQIEDLEEGKDYLIIAEKDERFYHTIMYYPLTFKGSEVLAKPTTPPEGVTGKWCIAGKNYSPGTRDQHWNQYTNDGTDFFFVFSYAKNEKQRDNAASPLNTKFAISRSVDDEFNYFDSEDNEIDEDPNEFGYDEDGNWYEDFDEKDSELDPDLVWAKNIIDKLQPKHLFADNRFYIDEQGVRFSKDRRKLERCPEKIKGFYKIPEGTEKLMPGCFSGTSLSKIEIPNTVIEICSNTFYNAHYLTEIIIGSGVERIGSKAFKGCAWLRELSIPDSVREIGDGAFLGCPALKKVRLPAYLKELHSDLFARCYGLEEVVLPKNLSWIWAEVFLGCMKLTKLDLPQTIQLIKATAFEECGVQELDLYPNVGQNIQGFIKSNLKKITWHGTEEELRQFMPNFFSEEWKNNALNSYGYSPIIPWGCEVYCTEDNKKLTYDKPAVYDKPAMLPRHLNYISG